MIRKYAKYLVLFYAAFLADFRAGAGDRISGQFFPQQNLQSDIDTIVLLKPNDTIADPFNAIIELYVKTFTPIWGTMDFPDSLIDFSINNTYSWDSGDILSYDPPSRRYDCESKLVYFFDDTLNHVHFHASYIKNEITYDTIVSFPVYYAKPVVNLLSINGNPFNNETVVVNSPDMVSFEVNLNRAYNYIDPEGYDKVIALHAILNGTLLPNIWSDPGGVRDSTVSSISLSGLNPGYNTIQFLAKGICKNNCEEYSDTVTVKVFYLDYEAIGPKVCQDNTVYEMTGIPEGGYFSGEGIINQTTLLNPSLASEGFHSLTYHYMVEGGEYTVPRDVEFVTLPDFELLGDQEVCYNAWDVTYTVNSLTGDYDNIIWDNIQGGEIIQENNDKSIVAIHWHGQGLQGDDMNTGKITVTMDKNGCSATKEFLVNIRITKATNPAFVMLYNNNLLICDDISALYFEWYINDVLKYTTDVPYCFLGEAYTPMDGDEYYVLTAIELCDTSCLTKSNTYVWNSGGFKALATVQNELPVYPNPSNGEFTILLPGLENNQYTLTISNSTGRVVASIPVKPSVSGKECRISGKDWPAGIYLLRLDGYSSSLFKKIMITR